jgi:hypothetical protein
MQENQRKWPCRWMTGTKTGTEFTTWAHCGPVPMFCVRHCVKGRNAIMVDLRPIRHALLLLAGTVSAAVLHEPLVLALAWIVWLAAALTDALFSITRRRKD